LYQYFVIHKPFNVLSQFTSQDGKKTLKDFFDVPVNVYPVGRLDYDSEGLLILTNDSFLNNYLLNPLHDHEREYWVQVEGNISAAAIAQIEKGVVIKAAGKTYRTKKCRAEKILQPHRNTYRRCHAGAPIAQSTGASRTCSRGRR